MTTKHPYKARNIEQNKRPRKNTRPNMKGDRRKMTVMEQIQLLKSQGIRFSIAGEQEAADFLHNHSYYFRIKFYGENYDKYQAGSSRAGQYINLDFAYLKELALLDLYLRRVLFPLIMDVEHYTKIRLLQELGKNKKEDGYGIVTEFFQRYRWMERELSRQRGLYAGGLVQKYKGNFAVWNVIEVITFSQLINLYELYHEKYGFDGQENLSPCFWAVKTLRNSIAHNNSLLNNLRPVDSTVYPVNKQIVAIMEDIPDISQETVRQMVSVPFLSDFTAALHAFSSVITSRDEHQMMMTSLNDLMQVRFKRHQEYFVNNEIISNAFDFMRKVVHYYLQKKVFA